MATAIEKTGQAIDATYISTTQLVGFPRLYTGPLVHNSNVPIATGT